MARRRAPLVIGLAVVLAVLVARVTVCAPDPVPVDVATVARGRVEQTVTNSRAGTVRTRRRAKLSPEVGGRVVAIPHREGSRVRAGDVVLELDNTLQRAKTEVAERELEAAVARRAEACLSAERAQRELVRNRGLAEQGFISADVMDRVESAARAAAATCAAAKAREESARASAELARRELEKTVLRAPFDGVVAEVAIEVGEWTTPSPPALPVPPVVDILDPASIYVSAPMDEVDSGRIRVGMPARISVDSLPNQSFPGRVVRIAPYVLDVEEQNRTVEIEAELDDAAVAATLLPGTSADVEVILEARDDVLRVPTSALLASGGVLVVEGNRLVARAVETGLRNWDYTEVTGGLEAGERVVTSLDRAEVEAGARVVVREGGAAP
ncbi:MAG TPA: efflux RND transporter periplasmic adaptor subunit [Candidatus Limnocylindria bacterium]|nr:efflux RND transporter periplasmic adaptor subunit [Candidatus Limnocylindria bacterium]